MSAEIIELDDVDALGTGAVGEPGQRAFYIQARTEHTQLTVLVEKEQVALLADRGGRVPRQDRRQVPRAAVRPPADAEHAARADRPAVPGPVDRARLRSRARARVARAARAVERTTKTRSPTTTRGRRGLRRAHLRDARAGAGHGGARRRGRRRRSSAVPAVRAADGSVRAPVSSLELTPAELRAALETAELEVVGRMRYSSNATFLVEAKVDGMELAGDLQAAAGRAAALGLPAGHAVPARGRGLRALRRARVGHRAAHRPARRPARCGRGAALRRPRSRRALLHACATTTKTRFRQFALFDVLANNTDRKGGHCLHDQANDIIVGIDHGLCFHEDVEAAHGHLGVRRRAAHRARGRRRVPHRRRPPRRDRCTSASHPCSTTTSSTPSPVAPRCSSPAACRSPATGTAPPGPSSGARTQHYLRL